MNMKPEHKARLYLASVVQSLGKQGFEGIEKTTEVLRKCQKNNNNLWIVGNGGSASNASHLANDLTKMAGIKAFSVPDMTSTTLAYGNDNGWKYMFLDTISKLYREGDAMFLISCSGNSPNIVAVAEHYPEIYIPKIVLTGNNRECRLAKLDSTAIIYVENEDITIQESIHSTICHALAVMLRDGV